MVVNPTGKAKWIRESHEAEFAAYEKEIQALMALPADEVAAHPAAADFPGAKERTILMHGFSKAFAMTGFRLGYACSPPELSATRMVSLVVISALGVAIYVVGLWAAIRSERR